MIRQICLALVISGLAALALRDWYKSLCGLILLVGIVEHPDMPKSIFGIQGLNPWNILLVVVLGAWLLNRGQEELEWDMPFAVQALLAIYLLIIGVGFFRLVMDMGGFVDYYESFDTEPPSRISVTSEFLINCVKWIVPGVLLFDGCRSLSRFKQGLFSLLGIYLLLGIQIIRWMPLDAVLTGGELSARSLKILINEVGFHRVNLSMMMAGGFWAMLCSYVMGENGVQRVMILTSALVVLFAQSLTAGRAGYATWAVIALFASLFKWRKLLLFIPILIITVTFFVSSVSERFLQGLAKPQSQEYTDDGVSVEYDISLEDADLYVITAGRNIAWPLVIEKIGEAPLFGYGREGMKQTGTAQELIRYYGESFPHPHNAYLELVLDNGVIGAILVLLFYIVIVKYSLSLFMDSRSRLYRAGGGVCLFLVMAFMVAGVGSQTFYPREGAVGMWCAIGLMLRIHVKREKAQELGESEVAVAAFGSMSMDRGDDPAKTGFY